MAKIRPASLSLTMPNPIISSGNLTRSSPSACGLPSGSPSSPRRDDDLFFDAKNDLGDQRSDSISHNGSTLKNSKVDLSAQEPASPSSPSFTSLPPFPTSPGSTPKHVRDPSKSFFSNLKASKSSTKIQTVEATIRQVPQEVPESNKVRKKSQPYQSNENMSKSSLAATSAASTDPSAPTATVNDATDIPRRLVRVLTAEQNDVITSEAPNELNTTKSKTKLPGLLKRTNSTHIDQGGRKSKPSTPIDIKIPEIDKNSDEPRVPPGPLTAPLKQEKNASADETMRSNFRNRSADRQPSPHSDHGDYRSRRQDRSRDGQRGLSNSSSQQFRGDGNASHFFSGIKSTTSRAAEGIGKASNRLMGKINSKPNSVSSKETLDDRDYTYNVIKLPLREQTRITRIAKRLENSKDKTEFWMPALPWRCIDYLNFKGCDEEGLYRVPGSGKDIRAWQKRFDKEHDIDLFDQEDLYDINIIGSMFKAWLRDLPDEIFPIVTQDRISALCDDPVGAPQMLKDELSMLPPWNYYLLFAITCHLSLLHAYVEKNKMTYNNLRICISPSLKLNGDCFRWLVCDWRNCWQGCWTEKEHLEAEYRILDEEAHDQMSGSTTVAAENRSISSADSNKGALKPPPLNLIQASEENVNRSVGNGLHGRSASQLPELTLPPAISPFFATSNAN